MVRWIVVLGKFVTLRNKCNLIAGAKCEDPKSTRLGKATSHHRRMSDAAAALAALEARLLLLEESKKDTDAKIAALGRDAGRAPFLSPTSARSLFETIKSSKNLRIVNGAGLPWKKSRFNVTLVNEAKLFSTLPKTPKILKEMAHLQPWLTRQTPLIDGASFRVSWVDGHELPSIGSRKPDIVHYPKGDSPSVFQLAIVGDLKSQTRSLGGEPSDEAIACLLDFLSALAAVQVWRRQFIGYLVDGIHISFFVVAFDSSPKRGETRAVVSAQRGVWSVSLHWKHAM